MDSQLQQAIRASKCKACDEGHAYYKAYGMPFNKQYGMHLLQQAQPFIDLKIPGASLMNYDQSAVIDKLITDM